MRARRRPRSVLVGVGLSVLLVAGCGVDVPDDVGSGDDATTTGSGPATTEAPTSDDPLEQALIDNGYTLGEARCAAENLRDVLDEDEIEAIVEADDLGDITVSSAEEFANAVQPCIEDGAPVEDPEPRDPGGGTSGPDPDGDEERPRVPRRPR